MRGRVFSSVPFQQRCAFPIPYPAGGRQLYTRPPARRTPTISTSLTTERHTFVVARNQSCAIRKITDFNHIRFDIEPTVAHTGILYTALKYFATNLFEWSRYKTSPSSGRNVDAMTSVRPSVTLTYRGHIGWVSSKYNYIGNLVQGERPKNSGGIGVRSLQSAENCNISEAGQDKNKIIIHD